jgi:hypothetical protein
LRTSASDMPVRRAASASDPPLGVPEVRCSVSASPPRLMNVERKTWGGAWARSSAPLPALEPGPGRACHCQLSATTPTESNFPVSFVHLHEYSDKYLYRYRFFLHFHRIFLQKYWIFLQTVFHTGFISRNTGFIARNPIESTRLFSTDNHSKVVIADSKQQSDG